ncbi:DnaJ domain containing protein [Sesbania bispinosa]|nr:DnaJ domain containing protein [Sesbania bispinosa]
MVLGVEPFTNANVIRKQYKKLVFLFHPDKNHTWPPRKLVGEAFHFLSYRSHKKEYDANIRLMIGEEIVLIEKQFIINKNRRVLRDGCCCGRDSGSTVAMVTTTGGDGCVLLL